MFMFLTSEMRSRGCIDVHVHFKGADGIDDLRAAGIVAARNAGMRANAESEPGAPGFSGYPAVVSSLWALYKRGAYGSFLGVPVETTGEIRTHIRELKRAGADILKVIASGMVNLEQPGVTPGGFDRDELSFIAEEAAGLGLGVMAHANGETAVIAAAEAGVRSVEHGFFMTERALEALAERGICWTPTIGALERAAKKTGEMKPFIRDLILSHLQMLRQAHAAGIPLAVGTDCILPAPDYAAAYRAELSWFQQAGIPRDSVLEIASKGGARLLGNKPV